VPTLPTTYPRGDKALERTPTQASFGRLWLLVGVLLILVSVVMIAKFFDGDDKDAGVWYDAGHRVLAGETLSQLPHYRYPPTFAVLVAPLAALGFPAFFFIWYAINIGLFAVSLRLAIHLVYPAEVAVPARSYWLPAALVAIFAIDNLFLGQTNILIMTLVYWSFLEDQRGRPWLSGLPLGLAIAIKAFPASLLAYFLYRRKITLAAASVLACGFFLFVLPAPIRGFTRNYIEVRDWADRIALPFLSRGQALDWGQHAVDFGNQSLPAVARRYLTSVDAQVAARETHSIYVNIADLRSEAVNLIVLGVVFALAASAAISCGWKVPRTNIQRAAEYSLITAALLLTSALSWTYFFVMLLLPIAFVVRLLFDGIDFPLRTTLMLRASLWGIVATILLLTNHLARACGCLFWATALIFAASALACSDIRHIEPTPEENLTLRPSRCS